MGRGLEAASASDLGLKASVCEDKLRGVVN